MIMIDQTTYRANSINERVQHLVLHCTEVDLQTSLKLLLGSEVSAHYLISDINPNHIFQLVDESKRAWHAGISSWQGRNHINDTSIGVEIVNLGYIKDQQETIIWYPYPSDQIESVIALCQNIIARYNIHPTCVVGHSDIAPSRKQDPGPLFPWKQLYDNGVGAWYDQAKANSLSASLDISNIKLIQKNFGKYGYNIKLTGIIDKQTTDIIKSFQTHFRPLNCFGILDIETIAILEALLEKYFPN